MRNKALRLLTEAEELTRIVNLVGVEALSGRQRWTLETAKLLREGLLQQSSLEPKDSFCSPQKQFLLLKLLRDIHDRGAELLVLGAPVQDLLRLPLLAQARRWKITYGSDEVEALGNEAKNIVDVFDTLRAEYAKPEAGGEQALDAFETPTEPGNETRTAES
jgi:V/A-type H+/Na+-transporting ATPase subunit A